MDHEQIRQRLDIERRGLARVGECVEVLQFVTRVVYGGGPRAVRQVTYASFAGQSEAVVERAIREQVEHARAVGAGEFEWKVYGHDEPGDLRGRLAAAGFVVGAEEAVMVMEVEEAIKRLDGAERAIVESRSGVPLTSLPACQRPDETEKGEAIAQNQSVERATDPEAQRTDKRSTACQWHPAEVVRVHDPRTLAMFCAGVEEAFGKRGAWIDAMADGLRGQIASGGSEHLGFMAVADGRAVSVGRLYTHPLSWFGGLYGGGTAPAFRGRGLYRAVVAARARAAKELGARYLQVDAGPMSRPILERLGFVQVATTCPCVLRGD